MPQISVSVVQFFVILCEIKINKCNYIFNIQFVAIGNVVVSLFCHFHLLYING